MKLPTSLRNVFAVAFLAVFAAGCNGNAAQPWHFWLAILLFGSAALVAFVVLPLGYYLKVYRLKHRGR